MSQESLLHSLSSKLPGNTSTQLLTDSLLLEFFITLRHMAWQCAIVCSANKIQKCFQLIFLASGSCWNLLHPPQPHSDRDWSKEGFLLFSFPWAKTNIMTTPPGPAATWMSHIMGYLPRWDLMHSAPHNVKYLACRSNNFVLQQASQMLKENYLNFF